MKGIDFSNKKVIVTGACGQLGSSMCRSLLERGGEVYGLDQKITRAIDGIEYFALDITNKKKVEEIFSTLFEKNGDIDILINNAGVSCFEPFLERPEESFDWVMDVNLKGTFFCIQEFVRGKRVKKTPGAIVNIASMYGIISPDYRIYTDCERRNSEVYGATKAGIVQMSRYFAVHLASDNIRVNVVSPGGIFNPENPQGEDFRNNYAFRCPMKRMAEADEITGGVLYLASDLASYTNGHNLIIDGAMSAW